MPKTIEKTGVQKDLHRAEELMKAYAEFKKEKDSITEQFKESLDPISTSMKEAEKELIEIAKRNRKQFDVDKNLVLEHGYVHIADRTVVKPGENFSWTKFLKKFSDFVEFKFKVTPIKKAFLDGDQRPALVAQDIDLKVEEDFEVKVKA
jgi:hypothetical protein